MGKKKFYAIVKGRKPGIYNEWYGIDQAETQVNGFSGAIYKSFRTYQEAEKWLNSFPAGEIEEQRHGDAIKTEPLELQREKSPITEPDPPHKKYHEEGRVIIYTDGGCIENPGPGGYGVVLLYEDRKKEISGGYARTTNNRKHDRVGRDPNRPTQRTPVRGTRTVPDQSGNRRNQNRLQPIVRTAADLADGIHRGQRIRTANPGTNGPRNGAVPNRNGQRQMTSSSYAFTYEKTFDSLDHWLNRPPDRAELTATDADTLASCSAPVRSKCDISRCARTVDAVSASTHHTMVPAGRPHAPNVSE